MYNTSDGIGDQRQPKKITGIIEKSLECPVCLELARPPVKQCSRGHIVCSICVDKMTAKKCPLCSQPFCVETSTCLNNLLEALPRLCKYSTLGCKEVYLPGEDEEHEDFCGFRSITCRHCNEKVQLNLIKEHYESTHSNNSLHETIQLVMTLPDFDPGKSRIVSTPVLIDNTFFYVNLDNNVIEGNLEVSCDAFYIGKPKTCYYVSVKFANEGFVQLNTIQAIAMKGERDADGLTVIAGTNRNVKEENCDQDRFARCISSLNKVLECPVCLEVARGPVRTCTRGHLTCSLCVSKLPTKECSLCHEPFAKGNPITLTNLLEALPRPCRYSEEGCQEVIVPQDDEDHEDFCGFRSTPCRSNGCGMEVQIRHMLSHFETNHPSFMMKTMTAVKVWPDFLEDANTPRYTPVFLDGHYFYVPVKTDAIGNLKFSVDVFFVGKPKGDYFLSVKLQKGHFVHHKTIKPIIRKSVVENGTSNPTGANEDGHESSMIVPKSFLDRFVDQKGALEFSLTFFKT